MAISEQIQQKIDSLKRVRYSAEYVDELRQTTPELIDALAENAFLDHSPWAAKVLRDVYVCRKYTHQIEEYTGQTYDEHVDWPDEHCEDDHTDITHEFHLNDLEEAGANIEIFGSKDTSELYQYVIDRQKDYKYRCIALYRLHELNGITERNLLEMACDETEDMDVRMAAVVCIHNMDLLMELLCNLQDEYQTVETEGPISLYSHPSIRYTKMHVEERVTSLCQTAFEKIKHDPNLLRRAAAESKDKHIVRQANEILNGRSTSNPDEEIG